MTNSKIDLESMIKEYVEVSQRHNKNLYVTGKDAESVYDLLKNYAEAQGLSARYTTQTVKEVDTKNWYVIDTNRISLNF